MCLQLIKTVEAQAAPVLMSVPTIEVEVWLSLKVYQPPRGRIEPLARLSVSLACGDRLCPLTGCSCHTTASQSHATGCVLSISSLLGSRGLVVFSCCRKVSRKFTCASTGAATLDWCQRVSRFHPALQFEVVSNSVHQHFSSFLVAQDTTRSFSLVQNLPTLMMGPLTTHTWNVIQILRPSRSFIGCVCSP